MTMVSSGNEPQEPIADKNQGGIWTPEAWHKSPEQLIEEARAKNMAGFSSAFANAGKHSNPPTQSWERDT